jgi:D-tyrosyl-tRNA(Tyr) deacylase
MRIVLQRVKQARVSVNGQCVAQIGLGVVILIGITHSDGEAEALWLAEKCSTLRIFEDEHGKTNLSIQDVGGEAIVVSQFTLYADTRRGRRPSFIQAADPEKAEPLVARFAQALAAQGIPTQMGRFGAHMLVEIENDGPVTILLAREAPSPTDPSS